MKFGRSSERREAQIEQLELRLEELEIRRRRETAAVEPSMPASIAAARPVRRPLPITCHEKCESVFPNREACPDCGGKLKHLGEDVSEILEYMPASLKVMQIRSSQASLCGLRSHRAGQSPKPADRARPGRLLGCWRMCWYRNTAITYLCIANRRSMLVGVWN